MIKAHLRKAFKDQRGSSIMTLGTLKPPQAWCEGFSPHPNPDPPNPPHPPVPRGPSTEQCRADALGPALPRRGDRQRPSSASARPSPGPYDDTGVRHGDRRGSGPTVAVEKRGVKRETRAFWRPGTKERGAMVCGIVCRCLKKFQRRSEIWELRILCDRNTVPLLSTCPL